MKRKALQIRAAGYSYLIQRFNLKVIPNWQTSSVSNSGVFRETIHGGYVEAVYPPSYWPGDRMGDHLEFALKYDGVNLGILSALFEAVSEDEITEYVKSRPTGKYARRIWFLFEFLTEKTLSLENLTSGNYVPVLEPGLYHVASPGKRSQRHRITNNLLGGRLFCPTIRRTDRLAGFDNADLRNRCEQVISAYPKDLLKRALTYMYTKETKSSFAIENIRPDASRTEKFISLLDKAGQNDFCEKQLLIEAQNQIVDHRFRDSGYRTSQSYVGQSISLTEEVVHYVCPRPEDVESLMEGLFESHHLMKKRGAQPVLHAAAVSFGFVFIHPFEDGNGRIHRFLIHNILSLAGFVPKGIMLPVSVAMINNSGLYEESLEKFSRGVTALADYSLNETGRMTVHGNMARWYRYIDLTAQAEALYEFVQIAIENELKGELDFLAGYDEARKALTRTVDMPDRLVDLFIRCCRQNQGALSARKRKAHFDFLTDEELAALLKAVEPLCRQSA